MKILDAAQIREWDRYTIEQEPISSLELMERAAATCTAWALQNDIYDRPVFVFCGKGNNGGDGLAIARQLVVAGASPQVYILESSQEGSPDFQMNLQRLQRVSNQIHFIHSPADFPEPGSAAMVVDALFGSGLSRPLEGLAADLVNHINETSATVISIDVPSGMFMDKSSATNVMIRADHTLTFQAEKLCLLVAENSEYFGEVTVLDIGLHPDFPGNIDVPYFLTRSDEARDMYIPRKKYSHKGDFGHALLIGGASGKTGAAILAAEACLRSGAGLTSVYLLSDEYTALNSRCPEAMTVAGNEMVKKNLGLYSAIGLGPGLGKDDIAVHVVNLVIDNYPTPAVLDADALNIIAQHPQWLQQLVPGTILTPHPKEFDRLFGKHEDSFGRFQAALEFSSQTGCIIVLKGHRTLIAAEGRGYFNTTGNAGLAKGGSGDALTGIITALLAQAYRPLSAARLGVYLHGLAADLSLEHVSQESMLASDVIGQIGNAFKKLTNVS